VGSESSNPGVLSERLRARWVRREDSVEDELAGSGDWMDA
jgi:hypothetical protein